MVAKKSAPKRKRRTPVIKKKVAKSKSAPKKKKMGRPKIVLDMNAVEKLSMLHCTQEEIAYFIGCSVDTLQRNKEFGEVYKKGMALGKVSVRRKQFDVANGGHPGMLIWLGKQLLGQLESPELYDGDTLPNPLIINVHPSKKSEETE